jgi:drug/metabolite transporter (DMT)-like permease
MDSAPDRFSVLIPTLIPTLIPILAPLGAALLFPFATLALKRAMESGGKSKGDERGALFVCNLAVAVVCLPLLLGESASTPGDAAARGGPTPAIWQPLLAGLFFFLAQVAAFRSFATGALSIAIPAQGAKVLVVAGLTLIMLKQPVGLRLWIAAAMTVGAIYLLQDHAGDKGKRKREYSTLAYAAAASACFAFFDVSIQKWSPAWGNHRFAPWAFLAQAGLSLSLLLPPSRDRFRFTARAWGWLLAGAFGLALITLALVATIGSFGNATQVNILFNSRTVWSVIFIWLMGAWFGNREADEGRGAMIHRLMGSALMMAAIILALSGGRQG